MRTLCLIAGLVAGALVAAPRELHLPRDTRGAVASEGRVWLWGGSGLWQGIPPAPFRQVARGDFAAAGCGSPRSGFLLQEGDRLVWLKDNRKRIVDTGAAMSDCLKTTLLGRNGWLVAHRGLQVRFYEAPGGEPERWPYREIYSFYTASYQSGLAIADVDRDGFPDIFCGNYWIRSPQHFDLPWRLFAINTYHEEPHSAHVRLALLGPRHLVVAQGELSPGKLASFVPPADVQQLWSEERLDMGLALQQPAALVRTPDGGFLLGERAGPGRIWWWRRGGGWKPALLHQGMPVHTILLVGKGLLALGYDKGLWLATLGLE